MVVKSGSGDTNTGKTYLIDFTVRKVFCLEVTTEVDWSRL